MVRPADVRFRCLQWSRAQAGVAARFRPGGEPEPDAFGCSAVRSGQPVRFGARDRRDFGRAGGGFELAGRVAERVGTRSDTFGGARGRPLRMAVAAERVVFGRRARGPRPGGPTWRASRTIVCAGNAAAEHLAGLAVRAAGSEVLGSRRASATSVARASQAGRVRSRVTWSGGFAGADSATTTWASAHGAGSNRAPPVSVGFGRTAGWSSAASTARLRLLGVTKRALGVMRGSGRAEHPGSPSRVSVELRLGRRAAAHVSRRSSRLRSARHVAGRTVPSFGELRPAGRAATSPACETVDAHPSGSIEWPSGNRWSQADGG